MKRSYVAGGAALALACATAAVLFAFFAAPAADGHRGPGPTAATPPTGGRQPKPPRRVELAWSPTYMANNVKYSAAQAKRMAARFDLIAANPGSFEKHVSAMKKVNPALSLLVYANATFVTPHRAASMPESEFARDSAGNKITSTGFGTYLMDPANPHWRTRTTATCRQAAKASHYDGCLVDLLTMGIFSADFVSALPVNPATGSAYTEAQWRTQLIQLAKEYVGNDPRQIIIGNSVSNYFRYWLSAVTSRPIVSALPGAQMEDFMRGAQDPANRYPSTRRWLQNVRVIRDIQHKGETGLFSTKLWAAASPAQVAAWESYTMASFLLAADGHSYYGFTDSRTKRAAMQADLPFRMPKQLGAPTTSMKHHGRRYERTFAHGIVIVNPTTKAVRVHLHHPYVDLQGHHVRAVRMKPHSGNVFLNNS